MSNIYIEKYIDKLKYLILLLLLTGSNACLAQELAPDKYLIDTYVEKRYVLDHNPFQSVLNTTFKYVVFQSVIFDTLFLRNVDFSFCLFQNVTGLNKIHPGSSNIRFTGSVLANLNLEKSFFEATSHNGTDFTGSDLNRSNFNKAELIQVDFTYTNLEQATFFNASIIEPTFTKSRVSNAFFLFSDLEGDYELSKKGAITTFDDWRAAIKSSVFFKDLFFNEISIKSEQLNDLILDNSIFKTVNLENVSIKFSLITNTLFDYVQHQNVSYHQAKIYDSKFINVSFNEGDMTVVKFKNVIFEDSTFKNINFSNSEFENVTFKNCIFKNNNFTRVKIKKTNFVKSKGVPKSLLEQQDNKGG